MQLPVHLGQAPQHVILSDPVHPPLAPHTGALTPGVQVLVDRGQAAVEAMGSAAADDPASRREAEAFQQLCLTRRLLELTGSKQWDAALQVGGGACDGLLLGACLRKCCRPAGSCRVSPV